MRKYVKIMLNKTYQTKIKNRLNVGDFFKQAMKPLDAASFLG